MCTVMTLTEIRESLAESVMDSLYKDRELMEIFLNGFTGYNNESDEDVVEWYVSNNLPDGDVEDAEPVEVLAVNDDSGSKCFSVVQHDQDLEIIKR